ncbi:hypothetical protein [Nonomuraea terrae]|nr:hypothetical protein [Nonomuraea terrae]
MANTVPSIGNVIGLCAIILLAGRVHDRLFCEASRSTSKACEAVQRR